MCLALPALRFCVLLPGVGAFLVMPVRVVMFWALTLMVSLSKGVGLLSEVYLSFPLVKPLQTCRDDKN